MASTRASVTETVREVVAASLELLRAEVAELTRQVGDESRLALKAAVLVAAAFAFVFWAVGLLLASATLALSLVVAPWMAALIVGIVFVVVGAVLAVMARSRFKQVRSPATVAAQRLSEHSAWWEREIQGGPTPGSGAPLGEGTSEESKGE